MSPSPSIRDDLPHAKPGDEPLAASPANRFRNHRGKAGKGGKVASDALVPGRRSRFRAQRAAMRSVAVLPTMLTLGNVLCGFLAIFLASRPPQAEMPLHWTPLSYAAILIFLGMFFDGLDGRIARLTGSTSELGEQLDSMADMVTFGVAPAFAAVQLAGVEMPYLSLNADWPLHRIVLVIASIYVACAALRLARFNIEAPRPENVDHMSFKGLPTPGAAGTVAGLVLLHQHFLGNHTEGNDWPAFATAIAMAAVMLLAAFAMVSKLRYAHVLNRFVRGQAPFTAITRAVVILLLLATWPQASIALAFGLYALSAPSVWVWRAMVRPGGR